MLPYTSPVGWGTGEGGVIEDKRLGEQILIAMSLNSASAHAATINSADMYPI